MALLLAKFEGMSYQDIAQTMGLSVQAIKSLLSRARVNLKELLAPYVESGTRLEQLPPDSSKDRDDETGTSEHPS
jgi:RNA polymerase sigma-70 factor (ECF subfamily)